MLPLFFIYFVHTIKQYAFKIKIKKKKLIKKVKRKKSKRDSEKERRKHILKRR